MILKKIQEQLQKLYHVELEYDVEGFSKIGSHLGNEALLIKTGTDHVEIALFLEPSIIKALKKRDPFAQLNHQNLNPFLTAIEGVSHFIYFLQRAEENQPVTQLELEIQAEIDKYLLASLLYYQLYGEAPDFLLTTIFENFKWHPNLNKEQLTRYIEANRLAAKFCFYIEQNYIRHKKWHAALEIARNFYRLNHWQKIRFLTP